MIKQDRGTPFSGTASGTATAILTQAAGTNVIYFITDISASTSASAGTVAVYGGASATTLLWQAQMGSVPCVVAFSEPLAGTVGAAVKIQANGTTATYVNMSGFSITAA